VLVLVLVLVLDLVPDLVLDLVLVLVLDLVLALSSSLIIAGDPLYTRPNACGTAHTADRFATQHTQPRPLPAAKRRRSTAGGSGEAAPPVSVCKKEGTTKWCR